MKTTSISTIIALALLTTGTAFAKGGQGRHGAGFGGPPKADADRAARQEQCQQANGGSCDGNGNGQGTGRGMGQGQGQGKRQGPRDGSGPRGGGANRQGAE